jgi:hypothetical protein
MRGRITVMIGVKGCSKSRTCMDNGATRPCLYFEGTQHTDLNWGLSKLHEFSETDYDALSLKRHFICSRCLLHEYQYLAVWSCRWKIGAGAICYTDSLCPFRRQSLLLWNCIIPRTFRTVNCQKLEEKLSTIINWWSSGSLDQDDQYRMTRWHYGRNLLQLVVVSQLFTVEHRFAWGM